MNLSDLSVKRPVGVMMLTLAAVLLGGYFLSGLAVDLLPRFTYPMIRISINWRGAGPQEVEENITKTLESAVGTTEDAVKIISQSVEGNASLEVYFEFGKDMDVALADTREKLDQIRKYLPSDVDPPLIYKADPSQLPVLEMAFSSKKMDERALRQWVEFDLSSHFLGIPGLGSVVTAGGKVREIHVRFNQALLQRYEISLSRVLSLLQAENIDLPAGRITAKGKEYNVRLLARFRNTDDIAGIVIANREGTLVRLRDVARVLDSHDEQRVFTRLNGTPCVQLSFLKQPNANTVEVVKKIEARAARLKKRGIIPAHVQYTTANNQAYYISNSIENVGSSALIGGILAMMVIWFFLHQVKRTLVIAISIPVSILSTFIIMWMAGITLNIFSLGGLVLAVGMLVDNSIVMLENITRHHHHAGDAEQAARTGSREMAGALVASTLTNIAAVLPFFFIKGMSALLFRDMVITIVAAFIISLLTALTVIPSLTARIFRWENSKPDTGFFKRVLDRVIAGYKNTLAVVLRFRFVAIVVAVGLFVGSLLLFRTLGSQFLPAVDDGKLNVKIKLPIGASLERNLKISERVEKMILSMPGMDNTLSRIGGYWKKKLIWETANESEFIVQLVPKSQRPLPTRMFIKKLRRKIKKARIKGAKIKVIPSKIRGIRKISESDIDLRIRGAELETLYTIASNIEARIRTVDGLANTDISLDLSRPEVHVTLNRTRLSDFGLTARDVHTALKAAVDGTVGSRFTDRSRDTDYDIRVLGNPSRLQRVKSLGDIMLYPATGVELRLKEVARIVPASGPVQIDREDQVRLIQVSGEAAGRNVGKVTADIKKRLANFKLPAGYFLEYSGEEAAAKEANLQMLIVVGLSIFLIFTVMAVQYESLLDPLVIMVSLPLSLVGAILLLAATNTPLGATVLLGMILLVGIVVNNAIVMIELTNQLRREKRLPPGEAVFEAAVLRLRPILMTTLTTVAGLLPLALGWGEGLEMLKPLALTVVGGLTGSTLLTLFIVPCVYSFIHRRQV